MKKQIVVIIAIAIIAILVIAVVSMQSTSVDNSVIKLGYTGPLTGESTAIGLDNYRGIELAIKEINKKSGINGKIIEIDAQDDGYNVKNTITNYQKFKSQDVDAILATVYGGALALKETAANDEMVVISSLDASEELADAGEWVFAIGIYDESIGFSMADFAHNELNSNRVALFYNNLDAFVLLTRDSFASKYNEKGGTVVVSEGYLPESNDFRDQILKVKANDLDTVVIIGYGEAGFFVRQLREQGFTGNIIGIDTVTSSDFLENSKGAEEGMYFTNWEPPYPERYEELLNKYRNAYGKEPDYGLFVTAGYDSMMMLAETMETSDAVRGKELQQALYKVKNHQGVLGSLTIDNDGITRNVEETIFQIKDGKFIPIR